VAVSVGVAVGVDVKVRVEVGTRVIVGSAVRVSATAVLTSEPNSLIEAALALDPQEVKTRAAIESTGKRILAGLCFIVLPSFDGS